MVNLQTFLIGLVAISTIASLVTEAIKKILTEHNKTYHANSLAGVVSIVLSIGFGIGYILLKEIHFSAQVAVYLVALAFMSWLGAMIGYDKVMQAIGQFKANREGEQQ